MGRRERAAGQASGAAKKRKRSGGGGGFEVVATDFVAPRDATVAAGAAGAKSTNTLRDAHRGAHAGASTAQRRAEEIWFRRCGHGEALFEAYYRAQPVIPPQGLQAFLEIIKTPLPVTFRLHAATRRKKTEASLAQLSAVARRVPWAGKADGIFEVDVPRRALKVADPGPAGDLARLLADGAQAGALNRQEVVSMLPVLALQVQPGDSCFDVCAAPGSKTMQLLEAVSAKGGQGGLVVANDAHPKRVQTLLDAIARHGRPPAERGRLLVTCHRGERFPPPTKPFRKGDAPGFDRVLADVPCSGDGTVRKDASVLPRWTPAVAHQLHAVQLAVAWRALEVLRPGGLMAYSTCSLNPVEDEAVVAALLKRANAANPGAVEVEAWPEDVLPKMKRRAGLATWLVGEHVERMSGDSDDDDDDGVELRWHVDFDSARRAAMPHAVETLWPPAEGSMAAQLARCSRLLPYDQDTGGFFVALLRKHAEFPAGKPDAAGSPPLEQPLEPLPRGDAERLGAKLNLDAKQAARRLLRGRGDETLHNIHVAPPSFRCFPASLNVASAGVPARERLQLVEDRQTGT
mmetsp:Transcript_558/g.1964  ORF Transcript_558/g.1964 Transcript_558/m.1964 type:complete len:574 (-) Transcript_558:35-1756(-)